MVQNLLGILPLLVIALLFFVLLIRPQMRRRRELLALQGSLKTGDEVMLTSGLYGTLVEVADDHVLVEIAPGTTVKVARGAVGQLSAPPDGPQESAPTSQLDQVEPEEY